MSSIATGVYIDFSPEIHVPFEEDSPCLKDSLSNKFKCESKYFQYWIIESVVKIHSECGKLCSSSLKGTESIESHKAMLNTLQLQPDQ